MGGFIAPVGRFAEEANNTADRRGQPSFAPQHVIALATNVQHLSWVVGIG